MSDIKKRSHHYVDNKQFYEALCEWKKLVVEAEESGDPRPPITDYIGECFVKIAQGLSRKACFSMIGYKDEMIGDAIENAVLYAHNFSPTKSKNPFAYFTQIMYYAFLRRIQKEKKQMYVKYKLAEQSDEFQHFNKWDDTDPHEKLSLNKVFNLSDLDVNNLDEKTAPKKKGKKASGGTLDFLEDD